jgi:uncharacterized protein YjbJ (UPF0337 family)
MGEHVDEFKGRVKQAAGNLTGDKKLEREGKADRTGSTVKKDIDAVKDKAEDMVDKVKEKLHRDDS